MAVVSWLVETADRTLDGLNEAQFGQVAGSVGSIAIVACTLAVMGVFVNMALQYRSMDGRTAFWLLIRISLIAFSCTNWANFNSLAGPIQDQLDAFAGVLVTSVGGTGSGSEHFATAFDNLIAEFGNYLNAIVANMNWIAGAVISAIGVILLSIIGALCAVILIYSKIMIAFMIAIAPIMIALSTFEATKDYFTRWLSTSVGYALYPLVIAGIFSTIIGISQQMIAELGDASTAESIGALVPFFIMLAISGFLMAATPFIVRGLSGAVTMHTATAAAAIGGAMAGAGFSRGIFGAPKNAARPTTAERAGQATRQVAALPLNASKSAGQMAMRMVERAKRLAVNR
jgi:type IV secretion system protein VirB6